MMKKTKIVIMMVFLLCAAQWTMAQAQKKTSRKDPVVKSSAKIISITLKNGDFESDAPIDIRKGWDGWSWNGGALAEKSSDSHSGKAALFVKKHNQNSLNHKISCPSSKGKILKVSFWAKGKGTLQVRLPGFLCKEKFSSSIGKRNGLFIIRPETYNKYEIYFEVSESSKEEGTLSFLARSKYYTYNTGQFLLDDVKIEIQDKLPQKGPKSIANYDIKNKVPLPPEYFTGNADIPEGMVNIAPYAQIRTVPFALGAKRIVDGNPASAAKVSMVEFSYNKPQKISCIRIASPPSRIMGFADRYGKGKYLPLISGKGWTFSYWGRPSWPWYQKKFKTPVTARSLRFYDTEYEVQILSPANAATALINAQRESIAKIPELKTSAGISTPEASPDQKVLLGFTIEPWMFGSQREIDKNDNPKRPLKEWDGWKKLIADYKSLKANFMLLFPPQTWVNPPKGEPRRGTYPSAVLWPSKVWYRSCKKNVLAEMCKSAHKNGIKIFPVFRDYALKEGATVGELNKEMAEAGVDAIPSVHDEQHFGIAGIWHEKKIQPNWSPQRKKQIERANLKFKREKAQFDKLNQIRMEKAKSLPEPERNTAIYNATINYPSRAGDPGYRRLVLIRYDNIGDAIAANAAPTRAIKPDLPTFSAFTCTEQIGGIRVSGTGGSFSENDVNGFKGGIDIVGGTSGYFTINDRLGWPKASYYTQVYRACSPKRQSMHTMNFAWGFGLFADAKKNPLCEDVYPPIAYIGNTLAAIFNKAVAVDFWRYNFMDSVPSSRKAISDAFHMADTACAWGAKNASIPKDVLVLRSRASEDWWALRCMYNYDPNIDDINKTTLGVDTAQWLGDLLIRNAFPYELYWQDQPQAYTPVICKFKTVVLAFPYSVGDAQLKVIEKAVAAGIPVIAIGAKGETDEFGDKRTEPALNALIKAGKIQFFDKDIQRDGNLRSTQNDFISLLEKNIGKNKRSLMLKRYGDKDVQAAMLEIKPDNKLVLLVNWSMSDTFVDLGINVPPSKDYKLLYRDRKGTSEMSIGGKTLLSDTDLKQFRVKMKKGDVGILRIFRKN